VEIILAVVALVGVGLVVVVVVLLVLLVEARKRAGTAESQALLKAKEYLVKREKEIRADAIVRSERTIKGKVAEQLVPFTEEFGYNPRDCRFLGSPLDFVVFDGLSEGALDKIVLVEVKTGLSRLSKRERQVRDVVDAGEVFWKELRL